MNTRVSVRSGGFEVLDKMVHNKNEKKYIYIFMMRRNIFLEVLQCVKLKKNE